MRLVSGVQHQELGCFVDGHVIHAALHGAKQVVVEVGNVDSLVDQQKEHPPCCRVSIGHHARDCTVLCAPKSGVICFNIDGSVIVLEYIGVFAKDTRVSVRV